MSLPSVLFVIEPNPERHAVWQESWQCLGLPGKLIIECRENDLNNVEEMNAGILPYKADLQKMPADIPLFLLYPAQNLPSASNHQQPNHTFIAINDGAIFRPLLLRLAHASAKNIRDNRTLQTIQETLALERSQINFLLDALPATISWVRSDMTYLAVNDRLAALFDLSPLDFAGRKVGFNAPDNSQFEIFVRQVFHQTQTRLTTEMSVLVQGEKCHFYFISHKYDQKQEAVIIGVDISERKRLEQENLQMLETLELRVAERTLELKEANEQLKELDRLKSKFVSDVSHELRTPVTNLTLYLDLIEYGKAEKKAKYFNVLRQEAERLTRIVEPILNLSRLEMSQEDDFDPLPLALNEIVEQMITAHLPRAAEKGLRLKFLPASDLPPVLGDADQISQLAVNMIANGLNYTLEGEVVVSTAIDKLRSLICLQVKDSGVGISEIDKPHLFERFYRGKPSVELNVPGSGLGLAISLEIVERHKGSMEVESEENAGSTFTVWLPAYAVPQTGSLSPLDEE